MKYYWKSLIIVGLLILFIILYLKVLPEIQEGNRLYLIAEIKEKFDVCLQGCMFYDNAIPYINNTKVGYFDYCFNDCLSLYNYEKVK